MMTARRSLAASLSLLIAAAAVPHQAAARAIAGRGAAAGAFGASNAGGVPRIELPGSALTPLTPMFGLVATIHFAAAPVPSASALTGALLASVPTARPVDAAKVAFKAQTQLALIGDKLSVATADGSDTSGILKSFFTGSRELVGHIGGSLPSPTLNTLAASASEGKATVALARNSPFDATFLGYQMKEQGLPTLADYAKQGKPSMLRDIAAKRSRPRSLMQGLLWSAGVGAVVIVPWLVANGAAAAALGIFALTAAGVPQIVKNFRQGAKATKDLALSGSLIWFAVAALLAAVSIAQGSSPWYIVSNLASAVASLIMTAQINFYNKVPGSVKNSLLAVGGTLLAGLLLVSISPSAAFASAMGLLIFLNWPQIRMNYELYRGRRRAPDGATPWTPLLLLVGSALHLTVALSLGDVFWAVNSAISILTLSTLLGQILLPGLVNRALGPVFRFLSGAQDVVIGRWRKLGA